MYEYDQFRKASGERDVAFTLKSNEIIIALLVLCVAVLELTICERNRKTVDIIKCRLRDCFEYS